MDKQIENNLLDNFEINDIVAGIVTEIEANGAWINIGRPEPIFISSKHISLLQSSCIVEVLTIGETREFIVVKEYNADGNWQLCLNLINLEADKSYKRIKQLKAEDITIHGKVDTAYPYGVSVVVESQTYIISNIHLSTTISNEQLVGKTIPLKFIPNTLCLSHRLAVQTQAVNIDQPSPQKYYLPGEIIIGKVIKLEEDCAWIDIGVEKLGYIHISQMWNIPNRKINSPKDILFVNQIRDFEIIQDYDYLGAISLSIRKIHHKIIVKRLKQIYQENITIHATVIRVIAAGALVNIEELLDCVSPFMLGYNLNSEDITGKILPLKILNLITHHDHVEDYIDFSLVHDCSHVKNRINRFSVGKIVTAKVRVIKKYGVIVSINHQENFKLSGLLKIDNISNCTINNPNSIFKIDQDIRAMIIEADFTMGRFSLSTKVLESEPGQMLDNSQEVYQNAEVDVQRAIREVKNNDT